MKTQEQYQEMLQTLEEKLENYIEQVVMDTGFRSPKAEDYIKSLGIARTYLKEKIAEKFVEKVALKAVEESTKADADEKASNILAQEVINSLFGKEETNEVVDGE